MNLEAQTLRHEIHEIDETIKRIEFEKKQLQIKLNNIYRNCRHVWGETKQISHYTPGYEIPGDPPGTCGVDWRGPFYVDSKTTYSWKRVCSVCGKEEETTRAKQVSHDVPVF